MLKVGDFVLRFVNDGTSTEGNNASVEAISMGIPVNNFWQNPAVGGTPTSFINYLDPAPFEPLVHQNWDLFEHYWREELRFTSPLYAVEIVFNARIYLAGQGAIFPFMSGQIPTFNSFDGRQFDRVRWEIGEIADRIGILPVVPGHINPVMPNLVYVVNPAYPKPGQASHGEGRGGKYSNL